MKRNTPGVIVTTCCLLVWLTANAWAQFNSGSTGADGPLIVNTSTNINMSDHPTGIYNYTSVIIATNGYVTFTPNVNNTPVIWLVQSSCVISGQVDVSGQYLGANTGLGSAGGPGGYRGGSVYPSPTSGQGPGGGMVGGYGGGGSYGTVGCCTNSGSNYGSPGTTYGNNFLIPLLGGSGAGASTNSNGTFGGGGGGGAILIAASGTIRIDPVWWGISANGGSSGGNSGSGGAVRLVAGTITGTGQISAWGGGMGRVRFDTYFNDFGGYIGGVFSSGSQFVVIPTSGGGTQLLITSVAGVAVSSSPTGIITTPDAVISAAQNNPIPIVVQCSSIPLNTAITVTVLPVNGSAVSAVGYNSSGSSASSTATIYMNMPRGGGIISASAATGN